MRGVWQAKYLQAAVSLGSSAKYECHTINPRRIYPLINIPQTFFNYYSYSFFPYLFGDGKRYLFGVNGTTSGELCVRWKRLARRETALFHALGYRVHEVSLFGQLARRYGDCYRRISSATVRLQQYHRQTIDGSEFVVARHYSL